MSRLEFKKYSRKSKFQITDYDRSFTSLKEYIVDKGIQLPKIEGNWEILFIDLNFKDLRNLINMERPNFHNILVLARPEVLKDAGLLKQDEKKVNSFDIFINEVIGKLPKIIDDKAARELYSRCRDDESKLETALEEIRKHPSNRITVDILNTIIAPVASVWASDVAASLLIYYNQTIPRKGHPLARYKTKPPLALVNQHVDLIGMEVSFYSVRKFYKTLFEAKIGFLKNQPLRGISPLHKLLVESVDVHTIMYCYLLFCESNPKAYYAVIHDILKRQQSTSTREESLLYACIFND